MAKHYIRLDGVFIIRAFSTAFEPSQEGDVCVNEYGGRHFNLSLVDERGLPKLKYIDGEIQEVKEIDLTDKITEYEASLPNPNMDIYDRMSQVEIIIGIKEGVIDEP
jgi:hypothetical protein